MPIRIVQSKQNARLKELRKALAHPGRIGRGLVGVEGPKLVEEALRAGLRVHCVFVGSEVAASALGEGAREYDILLVPGDQLRSALGTESPQLVAALVEPPKWTWADVLETGSPSLIMVLAGIQDPGNLGTILRSAEAFGASGVVCLPGTVNVWNQKAVRGSAGSVFRVPLLNTDKAEAFEQLRKAGVRVLTTAVQGAEAADDVNLVGPVAIVIGNEGNGVPEELTVKADGAITIPCPGPVESLNAAVAASVLLYEAARQRTATPRRAAKHGSVPTRGGGR